MDMPINVAQAARYQIAERLERLPISPWHTKIRTIIAFAWFFDAFDALAIAYVLPAIIPLWHIPQPQIGGLISIGYAGQALGSLLFGYLAQRYGRVPITIATLILFSVMSLACAFAWDYQSLFWMRFIQGFGLGGEIPVINTYLNEFAKAERRARFIILFQLAFPIGLLAASGVGLLVVPTIGWRWMFIIGAIPAFVALPLRFMLPESPRWLASRGRLEEADRVLRGIEATISQNGKQALPAIPKNLPPAVVESTRPLDLLKGVYARRTISVWLLWISTYLVAYSLLGWLPTIWGSVYHLSVKDALLYGFIGSVVGLVATLLIAFLLDWTGRKLWFGTALVLGGVSLLPLWQGAALSAQTVLFWVCVSLFWINSVAVGLGTFTGENYPTHLRAIGSGIAGAWQRAASMIGPLLVGLILPIHGVGAVFVLFAIVAILGGVSCFVLATETKGRTLEQLSTGK
jgi:putative MFS transporter